MMVIFFVNKTDGRARDFDIRDVFVLGIAVIAVVVGQIEEFARIGFESCIVKHVVVLLIIFFDKNAISYYTIFLSFFQLNIYFLASYTNSCKIFNSFSVSSRHSPNIRSVGNSKFPILILSSSITFPPKHPNILFI